MIRIKHMNISREQEDVILSTVNKAYTEFTLLLNTDVYQNLDDENGLEIFKEYDIHIVIPNIVNIIKLSNINRIKVSNEDATILFFSGDNVVFTLSLRDHFYSLYYNTEEKYYTLKASNKIVDLQSEYPIINTVIEEVNGMYEGRLYLKISPLDFNTKCLVYWCKDVDFDLVNLRLLEEKKVIEKQENVRLFTQLFMLTANSTIIYKTSKEDDMLHIGRCVYKDEFKIICQNIEENSDEEEFVINYTDILTIAYHFFVLNESVNVVRLYGTTLQLISNLENAEELELNLLENIDYVKKYKDTSQKISYLYSELALASEIEEEKKEKYKIQLDTYTDFMNKFNNLEILTYGGYLLMDTKDQITAISNISKDFRILDMIRVYLYAEEE